MKKTVSILTLVLFLSPGRTESLFNRQCFVFYENSIKALREGEVKKDLQDQKVNEFYGDLSLKLLYQNNLAKKVISDDFANSEIMTSRSIIRKVKFWSDKPLGSSSAQTKPDLIDLKIFELSNKWKFEFGRIFVQNSKGELLGSSIFTSEGRNYINGIDILNALTASFAQAWATGDFFEIKAVSFIHTHPGTGDSFMFSDEDVLTFKHIKATMEAYGLKEAGLEASILYENFWTSISKKSLFIPFNSSIENSSYKSENVSYLSSNLNRYSGIMTIARIADKIINSELKKIDIILDGMPIFFKSEFTPLISK